VRNPGAYPARRGELGDRLRVRGADLVPADRAVSPSSKYASQFAATAAGTKPISDLFTILAEPGIHIGRTDPQGQAFWEMVQAAQTLYHLPAGTANKILGPLDNSSQTTAETSLESFLQFGQLDAASA
jgi:molybdate/tungstate transport system substrate-binding protein